MKAGLLARLERLEALPAFQPIVMVPLVVVGINPDGSESSRFTVGYVRATPEQVREMDAHQREKDRQRAERIARRATAEPEW